jgi:hypothetical protein
MSLTAATYFAIGAFTQMMPNTDTSLDGSASSSFVTGWPSKIAFRWAAVGLTTLVT